MFALAFFMLLLLFVIMAGFVGAATSLGIAFVICAVCTMFAAMFCALEGK